ncbi:MAG TPA: serine/threonine-protein kinase, partial [Rhodocyclaceae bacterium]|nr:serine/threonine-protein kinase [Rhodocyclaceae bacterium]
MLPKHLGRYEITEILGRGAMGVVYKAHDPLIDRAVAIKTISYAGLTPAESKDFEQRFFLEAKSAGRLNHPNIVTIHDVGHSEEQAYIAMEFLVGKSLRDIIDSGVVLPASRMARYAYSVADGLAFAHANGVVHRDIKPANIMVLDSGRVKITDFGIALLPSGSLTTAGMAVGSPKYMAPEQVLGQKADHRSDIFSLGAVLYELLTGFPPFGGEDINAILYQVLNGAPPLPSSLNANLPQGFDRIVARALSKDPERRYQSAAEMASDLRNYKKLPGLLQAGHNAETQPEAAHPPVRATSGNGAAEVTVQATSPRT